MNKRSKPVALAEIPKASLAAQTPTPDLLLQMAMENNLDLDKLERLIALKKDFEKDQARKEYIQALSKFQSIVPEMRKNKAVTFKHRDGSGETNYTYQQLADIIKHIKEPLAECGLTYQWEQEEKGDQILVTCILKHTSGHEERGQPLSGVADTSGKKNIIQQKASTITYLKRYTLIGILGLASADVDTDGIGGKPDEKQEENTSAKIKLSESQMATAIRQIMNGQKTYEQIKEKAILTESQDSALKITQEQYDQQKKS